MWDRHRALLAERFRVLAPDLPGHGKSAGPFTVQSAVNARGQRASQVSPDTVNGHGWCVRHQAGRA